MEVYEVLHYPHVLLKKVSTNVETFSPDLQKFIEVLTNTMYAFDGIGLAAAQVGVLKRICIVDVSPYLSNPELKDWHGKIEIFVAGKKTDIEEFEWPMKLINPKITECNGEVLFPYDGCLSLPGLPRGVSRRHEHITVEALLPDKTKLTIKSDGILSICLQHEIDHLDGLVFLDRLEKTFEDDSVLEYIKEFENDTTYRRKIRKLKPMNARDKKFLFAT